MKGSLDLILVRRPLTAQGEPGAMVVYLGQGHWVPVEDYLADHPRPEYLRLAERLKALTEGPFGDRAGDLILIPNNGDIERPADRYYFSPPMASGHGTPSERDSAVPLIISHPQLTQEQLQRMSQKQLGQDPSLADAGQLLIRLRQRDVPVPVGGVGHGRKKAER